MLIIKPQYFKINNIFYDIYFFINFYTVYEAKNMMLDKLMEKLHIYKSFVDSFIKIK